MMRKMSILVSMLMLTASDTATPFGLFLRIRK